MENNILNEELNQMKYLFGYKPGKVISEQTQTSPQAPNPKNALVNLILDMVKNKTPYSTSPIVPGKIIAFPRVEFGNQGAEIHYMELAPSDGVVEGMNRMNRITDNKGTKISSMEQLEGLLKSNQIGVSKIENFSDIPTKPMSTLDIMYTVGGFNNPTAFVDFLQKNFGEKSKQVLMGQIQKRANSLTKEFDPTPEEARTLLQKLNPQTTQTTQPK